MSDFNWRATNDGKGYWCRFMGLRLVAKEEDGGGAWWGVYEGEDLIEDGHAGCIDEAGRMAENAALDWG